jgi:hypothetical protein
MRYYYGGRKSVTYRKRRRTQLYFRVTGVRPSIGRGSARCEDSRMRLRPSLVTVSTALVLAFASRGALAAPSLHAGGRSPCSLVTKDDVFRILGWTIDSKEKKSYDMLGATGSMCFLSSTQGQVIVTQPDPGTTYPGASVYSQSDAAGLARSVYGLGAEVVLYNGTVYVSKHHHKAAVRVVPNDHNASYDEVQGFANVIVPRLK